MHGLILCCVGLISCVAGDVIFEESKINYVKCKISISI